MTIPYSARAAIVAALLALGPIGAARGQDEGTPAASGGGVARGVDTPAGATPPGDTAAPPEPVPLADPLGPNLGVADAPRFAASPLQAGGIGAPIGIVEPPVFGPGRSYVIRPSIGVQVLGTDNVRHDARNERSDVAVTLAPSLFIAADTARIRGSLNYTPLAQFYANTPGQDRLDHRFSGQALASLLPGSFYLDMRGVADTRTASGGFTPEGTTVVDRRNRVQSYLFQASPYVARRFGGTATAAVGVAVAQGATEGDDAALPGAARPFFRNQRFTSQEAFGIVRSGEDFGRIALEARVSATRYSGTGVLDDARRILGTVGAAYAVTERLAVLAEGGYEDQEYSGTPRVRINGATYSFGVRYRPDPDSTITARYGRRDGFDSFSLEGGANVGSRTRVSASYADRLTTSARRGQDLLAAVSLDAVGRPADNGAVGGSTSVDYGNAFLAVQSGLLRVKRAAFSISRSGPRDTITLSLFREEQEPVSLAPGTVAFSQRGTSGSLAWARELTPATTFVGYLQYGTFRSPSFGNGNVATASASLLRRLTPTLSGSVQYAISRRDRGDAGGTSIQNLVLLSLRQDF